MSNGYLAAASADLAAAHEIADGFGLDVIDGSAVTDQDAVARALAGAANVGLILSLASAQDEAFVAFLRSVVSALGRAQLILVEPEARQAFPFLPEAWPQMPFSDARMRAQALVQGRQPAPSAEPPPPASEAPDEHAVLSEEEERAPQPEAGNEESFDGENKSAEEEVASSTTDEAPPVAAPPVATPSDGLAQAPEPPPVQAEAPEPPASAAPPAEVRAPAPAPVPIPAPQAPSASVPSDIARADEPPRRNDFQEHRSAAKQSGPIGETAPADATAFAPKKLRRGTPELVRIVMHQPRDLAAVIKAARKIDPSAAPAPQGMSIGDVALGASVGVSLEVRGATCDGTIQRRTWAGAPIDFSFSVEADAEVRQAVILARVFIDDAQIGVIAFTRPVSGPAKKPASVGDRVRLKRHKRVFLSYSSHDRETVSAIATAYQMAGVDHFWDRASLKSGEEWSPRLRREIDRSDLFHLCWSRSAAASQWVEKETEHALTRRRRTNGKQPDITVQMLDGPPWAPHPKSLDSINFDDFVRAAIVGYARGEG